MANEQVNIPSLLVILLLSGLIVRYLFFSSPVAAGSSEAAGGRTAQRRQRGVNGGGGAAEMAAREAAAERILQMFPQMDRRTVLWDLQRGGGSIAATTERILAGRMETPPQTFQPPPPPGTQQQGTGSSMTEQRGKPPVEKPSQPDLITRYNLQKKLAEGPASDAESSSTESGKGKTKAWSTNRDERQSLLQKRRDQMILEARRKMEAKIAAEKTAGVASGSTSTR